MEVRKDKSTKWYWVWDAVLQKRYSVPLHDVAPVVYRKSFVRFDVEQAKAAQDKAAMPAPKPKKKPKKVAQKKEKPPVEELKKDG